MKIFKYGLLNKKTNSLVGISTRSEDGGDCCYDTITIFDNTSNNIWLVDSHDAAEKALYSHPQGFNADYNTPQNDLNEEDYKIVEIIVEVI